MAEFAISAKALTRTYGETVALDGLDLEVERGQVFGFLGPNGSGKSTAIRILIDLIRPTSGTAKVLGLDPRAGGAALRRRVGYLPGDVMLDGRQSSAELLNFLANLRGGVPTRTITDLADRLRLDLNARIKTLSRGNRQKVGLIQAVMHEPELLILDEPTSGLDPFLQHEFAAMMREVAEQGRTAFVSSHVMGEVQQIADRVAIIRDGRIVAEEQVAELRNRAKRNVSIDFERPPRIEEFASLAGVSEAALHGTRFTCRLDGRADALVKAVARHTVIDLMVEEPALEDLFFKYYDRDQPQSDAP